VPFLPTFPFVPLLPVSLLSVPVLLVKEFYIKSFDINSFYTSACCSEEAINASFLLPEL